MINQFWDDIKEVELGNIIIKRTNESKYQKPQYVFRWLVYDKEKEVGIIKIRLDTRKYKYERYYKFYLNRNATVRQNDLDNIKYFCKVITENYKRLRKIINAEKKKNE